MDDHDDHHRGLAADLSTLLGRRRMLTLLGGAGLVTLVGCASDSGAAASSTANATTAGTSGTEGSAAATAAACAEIPEETAGPYPGDGSNGPDILNQSGIVRSDIRSSIGSGSGVAKGVPLTIELTVQDASNGCGILSGVAVYLWHCNIDGSYSMYSRDIVNENYLRGVQETDNSGKVRFTSIFPAAYSGRWPHIHFEVYPSLAKATDQVNKIATSQLALPEDACKAVYATDGYSTSVQNLARSSLKTDNVFRDGWDKQLATVTGSVADGYTATLTVAV